MDRLRALVGAADLWAAVLTLGVAAFGFAVQAPALLSLIGAVAILLVHYLAEAANTIASTERPGGLTPRRTEIVCLIGHGSTDAEIASALHITEGAVENHVRHIRQNLHMKDRAEIKAWYEGHRRELDWWRRRDSAQRAAKAK